LPSKNTSAEKKVITKSPVADKRSPESNVEKNGNYTNGSKMQKAAGKITKPPVKKIKQAEVADASVKKASTKKVPAKKKTAKKTSPVKTVKTSMLTVEFRLRFHTQFGQSLYITGNTEALGNLDIERAIPLSYLDDQHWSVKIEFPLSQKEPVSYHYVLRQKDGSFDHDWGTKTFDPTYFSTQNILVSDSWNHAGYFENVFYTEPFRAVLLHKTSYSNKKSTKAFTHRFIVKAPTLNAGEVVCILGSGTALGNWNIEAPILLNKKETEDSWTINLDLTKHNYIIEYKYGVYNTVEKKFVRYESGKNRFSQVAVKHQQVCMNDGFVVLPNDTWKGAGIAIPVFSLRTERSFGTGEFTDIKLLVDWVKQTGFKMIQLLPVNDTSATQSWKDSYPYAAISAFALHPMFLDLAKATESKNKKLLQQLEKNRIELNASPTVDYSEVVKQKWGYIKQIFPLQKAATFKDASFKEFFNDNEHWLVPYAVFCYLKDEYGTSDFNQWPDHNTYNEAAISALAAEGSVAHDKINIHFFVQYHLHLQLKEASEYAHANGVILKGDIPIGVYRFGADAWQQPELYHLDVQAGAPPDDFAVKGQNWSFPTYNWEKMKQDGFKWWNDRFHQMSYYFDAFRIDHILGFFRIWSIPLNAVEGIMGRFVPAVPVDVKEFSERNIYFDYLRYCRSFINDQVLNEKFGEQAAEVKEKFLVYDGFDHYVMKDEFDTQRKVEQYFAGEEDQQLKEGLYDLISNVILFEEEGSGGTRFHFRFAMEDTLSFKYLDAHTQYQLKQLYVNYFFERQDHHWEIEAMQKLPGLKRATNMLVCGEDLGLVPHCVPNVMKQLGILSLEIQRMPKAVKKQFFNPADAPYLSVVTPSTHDMSTVRSWWEEDRTRTQQFYNNELRQPGDAPYYCEPWISKAIILQHLYSPAMWSIFQMQDLLGISGELRRVDPSEERINLPSNPQHYWNYRMHITLEDLLKADEFNAELKEYLESSGRN
jgi:4-alpha-glucanotransferase